MLLGVISVPDDSPTLVVPPATVYLQVPGRESFSGEAALPDECNGCNILRLYVGFQPMQLQSAECITNDGKKTFPHISLPLIACECIIAQVAAAKGAVNDICQIYHSHQLAVRSQEHEEAEVGDAVVLRDVSIECAVVQRCRNPGMMKPCAGTCSSYKNFLIGSSDGTDGNVHTHTH